MANSSRRRKRQFVVMSCELPALKRGNAGLERDIYDPPERQPAGELVRWLPGCPAGGLDKRSLLGSCGQHFALLLTGPATDMGACDQAVSCLIGNVLACLLDMPGRSQTLIECRVTVLPAPSRWCR